MNHIRYTYINYTDAIFNEAAKLRYEILFKPYGKIKEYKYDEFDKSSFHLAGICNNKIISYSRLTPEIQNNSVGKISNVVVEPKYNNMGIGLEMMKKHIQYAKENKFNCLYLHARVDTINFYRKAGFKPEGNVFISDRSGLSLQKMVFNIL